MPTVPGVPIPGLGFDPYLTENLRPSGYPDLAVQPVAPNAGGADGLQNMLRVQGTLRQPCPAWISPAPGEKLEGERKYSTWRKRFLLWAEGELLTTVPPGLVARDMVGAISGIAHDCLIEMPRQILYRPRENNPDGSVRIKAGLELCLLILDWGWGMTEIDDQEEKSVEELDNYWRPEGTDMATFRMNFGA
jgi:hypothetical protein